MVESTKTVILGGDDIANAILQYLNKHTQIADSGVLVSDLGLAGLTALDIEKALKSLLSEDYVELTVVDRKVLELSEEAHQYVRNGTPEVNYTQGLEFNVPTNKKEFDAKVGEGLAKIGFSKAMQ